MFPGFLSPQFEPALKHHFRHCHDQKNGAYDGVKTEERDVDPVQAAAAGNPMFQHQAADDDHPADEIRDAEPAEQTERQQQAAHDQVREKRRLQRVLLSPRPTSECRPCDLSNS